MKTTPEIEFPLDGILENGDHIQVELFPDRDSPGKKVIFVSVNGKTILRLRRVGVVDVDTSAIKRKGMFNLIPSKISI